MPAARVRFFRRAYTGKHEEVYIQRDWTGLVDEHPILLHNRNRGPTLPDIFADVLEFGDEPEKIFHLLRRWKQQRCLSLDEKITVELLRDAEYRGSWLQNVPPNRITYQMCRDAVAQDPQQRQHIPNRLRHHF